jgi:hypothetical protein
VALIVEDGTGVANANAYASLAFADSYHALRANKTWADATVAAKTGAIIRATDYVDQRWRFVGQTTEAIQALAWPRINAIDVNGALHDDEVPEPVKKATAEYALRALERALLPDPSTDDGGKFVTLKREKLGPLEEETRFSEALGRAFTQPFPSADRILSRSGLVVSNSNRTIRA